MSTPEKSHRAPPGLTASKDIFLGGSVNSTAQRLSIPVVDDWLFEVRCNPPTRRELMELEGAKRTIGFLSKGELQT